MSKSSFEMPDIGTVHVTKKRGQKTMRLRVDNKGLVQVSMPWMVPRSFAVNFVVSKKDWIKAQQAGYVFAPYNGMLFGKTMRLVIEENSSNVRSKVSGKDLIVYFPNTYDPTDPNHVDKIKKAIMRTLRNEAESVLLPRLKELAELYGFRYKSAGIKQVTGRWGSCDSKGHISLSIYLIQLPIELIDYVLIHELAHTSYLNHSPAFWAQVEKHCPDYKILRRKMKDLRPKIYDAKTFMS